MKRFKEAGKSVRVDAAFIVHLESHAMLIALTRDMNLAVSRAVLQGIASEVGYHLCESIRVPFPLSIPIQVNHQLPVWKCQLQFVDYFLGNLMEIDAPRLGGNARRGA